MPIEIDKIETKRIATLNLILKDLEKIKTNKKNSQEAREFAENKYNMLVKDKDKIKEKFKN